MPRHSFEIHYHDNLPIGPTGPTGPMGIIGRPGEQGLDGPTGPKGDIGPTGGFGIKGDTGNIGPTGKIGLRGLQGITGPTGPRGNNGASLILSGGVPDETYLKDLESTAKIGESYLVANSMICTWNGKTWDTLGYIQGPTGPTGPRGYEGSRGPMGLQGAMTPKDILNTPYDKTSINSEIIDIKSALDYIFKILENLI